LSLILALLLGNSNIGIKTLQNSKTAEVVNIHEGTCHFIAHYKDEDKEWNRLINILLELWNHLDHSVSNQSVENCNESFSSKSDKHSNTVSNDERSWIFESKNECRQSGRAETVTGQGNLDVCVRIKEFDKPMEAVNAASHAIRNAVETSVTATCNPFNLFIDELENDHYHPDNSKQKCA